MSKANQVVAIKQTGLSAMSETEVLTVLKNSLYPGASDNSVKMVLNYCQASGLDPMQKPVHIVPMSVKNGNEYEMRDVIMPGIGLYRTQAARSGEYGGITEPDYGEDVSDDKEVGITYPKWCKVTVKRIINGSAVEFTAKEFWKENYATKKRGETKPNAMWERRPYAQIAKCAEAQALRKAFPEVGAQPTFDEMDGKQFEETVIGSSSSPASTQSKPGLPECTQKKFDSMCIDDIDGESGEVKKMGWESLVKSGSKTAEHLITMLSTKYTFSDAQLETMRSWEKK